MTEPDQELSMIHVSTGVWLLGIDLVSGASITKNAMGIVHITGEEDLYHMEGVEEVEKDPVEVMEKVDRLAKELGVDTDKFLEVVKKLGDLVEDKPATGEEGA